MTETRGWDVRSFNGESDYLELPEALCPHPANRALTIAAWLRPGGADGVIFAHGEASLGYALYLQDRKLTFAVNTPAKRSLVQSPETLSGKWVHVTALLDAEGKAWLFVHGRQSGEPVDAGLLPANPAGSLQVGNALGEPVKEDGKQRLFRGAIGDLQLVFGACPREWIEQEAAQFRRTPAT